MTFDQADTLCGRIIAFLRSLGGPYPEMDEGYLQRVVLECLATRQFVLRIDREGIRYFACWWWLDRERLDAFLSDDPEQRVFPDDIRSGPFFYVVEVGSRGEDGDARQMIRRLRNAAKGMQESYWHQAHRNHRVCRWKENR